MKDLLFVKNRVGFIDGTINQPADKSPEMNARQRSYAIIKGWLTTTIEKEVRNSVKYAKTTLEI